VVRFVVRNDGNWGWWTLTGGFVRELMALGGNRRKPIEKPGDALVMRRSLAR
jgi:hypothetical protein